MIIVLDNIRSGHNVGSILRTAEFFGLGEIYLGGITPGPEHKEVKKTSLGAEKNLRIKKHYSIFRLVAKLKKEGHKILALEQDRRAINIFKSKEQFVNHKAFNKLALVIGNELTGVSKKVLALADCILEIPRSGQKESLNVSVAFGIAAAVLSQK